jgi:hypothetical protein
MHDTPTPGVFPLPASSSRRVETTRIDTCIITAARLAWLASPVFSMRADEGWSCMSSFPVQSVVIFGYDEPLIMSPGGDFGCLETS